MHSQDDGSLSQPEQTGPVDTADVPKADTFHIVSGLPHLEHLPAPESGGCDILLSVMNARWELFRMVGCSLGESASLFSYRCLVLFFGEVVVMGMEIFNVAEYLRDLEVSSSISVFLSILGYYSCILGMHFHIFGGKNVLRKLHQYAIDL